MLQIKNLKAKRVLATPPLMSAVVGFLARLLTNKSICFTFILTLCCVSLMASLSQISFKTHTEKAKYDVSYVPINRKYFQARIKKSFATANEKDLNLAKINTSSIKRQGLLASKKQQNSRMSSSEVSKKNKNNSLHNENLKLKSKVSSYEKGNLTSPNHPIIPPKLSKSDFTGNATEEKGKVIFDGPANISDISDPRSPNSKSDYYNTATDDKRKQEGDYGEVMGQQLLDRDYDSKIDPVRESFLDNVSQYRSSVMRRRRLLNYYNNPITLLPKQSKGIVILTNYRSGSTFLGELFNQHPEAFYTFEPLFPFTGGCGIQGPKMAQILHRILKCDFPSMMDIYGQVRGPMRKSSVDIDCLLDNFCFRKYTKELCEKDHCALENPTNCRKCGPIHLPRVMNACRAKQMSVVKVIRLCDIQHLKPLINDPSMDVKIVHLVRDPRGIESSRSKIHKKWSIKENAEATCDRLLHNALHGIANTSSTKWLKGRYMRVRYEDLSLEPLKSAEKIYRFAGLEFLPRLKDWINKNTKAPSRKKVHPYSTKRDSAVAMQAWRKHLTFQNVKEVQSVCADVMNFLGYKSVANQSELNNLDVRLLR